ncbi:MAG: methionyl-tRNA formyltransferase, partial [Candidatus Thioglobus sp.]|nr:methionyl-tRNA formyltransferase [Candidatus Thioglobus sp.]
KFNAKVLRILSAKVIDSCHLNPGEVIDSPKGSCYIATGDGALSLERVQLAGKKAANIKDFTNAYWLTKLE